MAELNLLTLGGFLQERRARVTPSSVGLRGGPRRRVPGLRREEVAQLAGISVEYYQRLEQGRAIRPSEQVLDALARVLDLDAVERAHLGALGRPVPRVPDEATGGTGEPVVRLELERMLGLLHHIPALVLHDRFDVLAANLLARRLFALPPGPHNLLRHLLLDPAARGLFREWEEIAATSVGQLRLAAGRYPDDEVLAGLVAELLMASEDFHRLWAAGDVDVRTSGVKTLRHPDVGDVTLFYENFDVRGDHRQRLVTLTPEDDGSTEAALALLLLLEAD